MNKLVWTPNEDEEAAVASAVLNKVRKMNLTANDVEAFLDSDGHICIRTKAPLTADEIYEIAEEGTGDRDTAEVLAFLGTDVIISRRDDVRAVDHQLGKYRESCGGIETDAYGDETDMVVRTWHNMNGTILMFKEKDLAK